MQIYIDDLIERCIELWSLWRDAQTCDEHKQLVDDVYMEYYLSLDQMRDILS